MKNRLLLILVLATGLLANTGCATRQEARSKSAAVEWMAATRLPSPAPAFEPGWTVLQPGDNL